MITNVYDLIDRHLSPCRRSGRDEIRALSCPFCKGGMNGDTYTFSVNTETGAYHCFRGSCDASGSLEQLAAHFGEQITSRRSMNTKLNTQYGIPKSQPLPLTDECRAYFNQRGISDATLEKYGVSSDRNGNILFPFTLGKELTYVKFRKPRAAVKNEPKEWTESGNLRPILFGMDLCDSKKPLVITEGMIDALSLAEVGIENVVSVPSGCENLKFVEECFDWLEQFTDVVIFGDNDAPGRRMVNTLMRRLGEARCKYVDVYPLKADGTECKDANEILTELGDMVLLDTIDGAKDIPIKGLIDLASIVPEDPTTIERIRTCIPALDECIDGLRMGAVTVFTGATSSGKLLADDTPVITKDGWKNHGDLQVGDYVLSINGQWAKVLHVFPKDVANMKVTFTNHEVIYCHENHEWVCECHSDRHYYQKVCETKEIYAYIQAHNDNRNRFRLPDRVPMFGSYKELAVEPYTLGAWLGDGRSSNPDICCDPRDIDIINGIVEEGYPIKWSTVHKDTGVLYFGFDNLRFALQRYGMCVSRHNYPKYIPDDYIVAPVDVRLRLLAGLLDTDGCRDSRGSRYSFSTTSVSLKDSFISLISSFGWRTTLSCEQPKLSTSGVQGRKPVYTIQFMPDIFIPCRLPRKQLTNFSRSRHIYIQSIEPCAPRQGNCIMVEGGIYCVGHTMLPTHNSTLAGTLLLNAIEQGYNVCAFSGELGAAEFQNWINLQAAGSDYITLKYDRIKNKDVPVLPADVQAAIMNWYQGHFMLYDNNEIFDSNQADAILKVFTMAVRRYDCRLFLVDNLMMVTSDTDEETRAQGRFMNAVKRFANKYNVHVMVVAHARKLMKGQQHIGNDDISGNSATVKLAHSAIVVEKPNLRVIKSRSSGINRLIECCYCPDSHRIYQKDAGDLYHYGWNDGTVPQPRVKACDSDDYQVQLGQPEQMF